MVQSKKSSLIEAKVNTMVAIPINYYLNVKVIELMGEKLLTGETKYFIIMTGIFTVVSVLRNYLIRRFFNR
jgi:hypothetical protein